MHLKGVSLHGVAGAGERRLDELLGRQQSTVAKDATLADVPRQRLDVA